jgi:hypothetical protein
VRRIKLSDHPPHVAETAPAVAPHDGLRANLLCVAVLLVITLAVYAPALFGGRVLLPADIVPLMRPWSATARERFPDFRFAQNQMHGPIFEYYSWRHYARERILAGEAPLWNPYELGGNVLLANSQSAVLYPPNILLYALPLWVGINLVTALHTFLTGGFLFFLLRRYRLGPPAAMTGALVWMFCGLQVVWTEFQTPTAVLCWLPAGLLAWERAAQARDWRSGFFLGGAVIALILLAGHLHFAFYTILAFLLYGVWRTFTPDNRTTIWRPLLALGGALLFGVILSAATMMPVFEMARMNFRGAQDSYAASIGLRMPPKNLLTLLLPNVYGNPRDYVAFDASGQPIDGNHYFGAFDFIEYTAYVGIPALLLALVAVAALWQNRKERRWLTQPAAFFALLALLGLLLALGTPFCAIFFYGVPGYRQFNATARALCLFSFGAAALAAFGAQTLMDWLRDGHMKRAQRITGFTGGVLAAIGFVGFAASLLTENMTDGTGRQVARLMTDEWFGYELGTLARFGAFLVLAIAAVWLLGRRRPAAWLLPAIAVADLLLWGHGFNPMTDPRMLGYPTQTTNALQNKSPDRVVSLEAPGKGIKSFIVPNYNAVVHLREVQGADSLHTRHYHQLLEQVVLRSDPGRTSAFTDPNTLHVPNVNHPFFNLMNVRYVTTDPEVQLSPPFRKVQDAELAIWANPNAFGPAWNAGIEEAYITQTNLLAMPPDQRPDRMLGTATVTAFSPHRIAYDVTRPSDGLLVTSEMYFPGWSATVDGHSSPVISADWFLRATPVAAGRHTVEFRYEPASYRAGLYLTCAAASMLAWFFASRRTPHRPTLTVPLAKQ